MRMPAAGLGSWAHAPGPMHPGPSQAATQGTPVSEKHRAQCTDKALAGRCLGRPFATKAFAVLCVFCAPRAASARSLALMRASASAAAAARLSAQLRGWARYFARALPIVSRRYCVPHHGFSSPACARWLRLRALARVCSPIHDSTFLRAIQRACARWSARLASEKTTLRVCAFCAPQLASRCLSAPLRASVRVCARERASAR